MKIENIKKLYALDADRVVLSKIVLVLDKDCETNPVIITIDYNGKAIPLTKKLAIGLREMARKQLIEVEKEIESL